MSCNTANPSIERAVEELRFSVPSALRGSAAPATLDGIRRIIPIALSEASTPNAQIDRVRGAAQESK